ncbi:MAG: tryptophan 7-halogenase [Proteobacteria bacterium]|nr:tryptophan 7-halogenase [Pseudomonadota bacterium]
MIKTDVLVIGAGPSGCVASAILQKQGLRVHVVEKEKFPRFVIGESLLPRCMEALDEAGLLEAVKRQGFQEKFGAKFIRNDEVCDFNFADQFTQAWNWTARNLIRYWLRKYKQKAFRLNLNMQWNLLFGKKMNRLLK